MEDVTALTGNTQTTTAAANNEDAGTNSLNLDQWKAEAKEKLGNLSTSNADILDFICEAAQDGKSSDAKMQIVNYLINTRSTMCTMLTNTLRALFDASNAVIHNIRLS
jgi:hypothetical protein